MSNNTVDIFFVFLKIISFIYSDYFQKHKENRVSLFSIKKCSLHLNPPTPGVWAKEGGGGQYRIINLF